MTETTIRYFWIKMLREPEPTIAKITYDENDQATGMYLFGSLMDLDPVFTDEGGLEGFQWEGEMLVPHFNILRRINMPDDLRAEPPGA